MRSRKRRSRAWCTSAGACTRFSDEGASAKSSSPRMDDRGRGVWGGRQKMKEEHRQQGLALSCTAKHAAQMNSSTSTPRHDGTTRIPPPPPHAVNLPPQPQLVATPQNQGLQPPTMPRQCDWCKTPFPSRHCDGPTRMHCAPFSFSPSLSPPPDAPSPSAKQGHPAQTPGLQQRHRSLPEVWWHTHRPHEGDKSEEGERCGEGREGRPFEGCLDRTSTPIKLQVIKRNRTVMG